jgi:hypothetical protein
MNSRSYKNIQSLIQKFWDKDFKQQKTPEDVKQRPGLKVLRDQTKFDLRRQYYAQIR